MSHSKERSEKVCLNCNAGLNGRYCHVCGQENIEPKETVWGLITHFFYDITHFDGKFFSTVKYLVARPGFLPAEYSKGRRAAYLHPIRMYVFTSAFFFIIFFSIYDGNNVIRVNSTGNNNYSNTDSAKKARDEAIQRALALAHTREDSADIMEGLALFVDTVATDPADSSKKKTDTSRKKNMRNWDKSDDYKTVEEYDSVQAKLPEDERDGWFERVLNRREIALRGKYGDDNKALFKAWGNAFIHQFPKLLFVSLPIFAAILRLLYIRRRKQFYYVDHGIFTIYLYIFSFVLLLVAMAISWLTNITGWDWINLLQIPLWLYSFYYIYKAMRVFYRQSRGKTIVKFILLNIIASISIITLFVLFFVFAIFQL